MIIEDRIKAFEKLGDFLMDFCNENSNSNHPLETIIQSSSSYNGWFTSSNIRSSISAICNNLSSAKLSSWLSSYSIPIEAKKNVSIIMAGNIPLVGFNDFLCVLMSGHRAIIKLSSKDNRLFLPIIEELIKIEPRFKDDIKLVEKVENFDAVIATGSNESFKHFEYYFKDYPTLLRKSRTSVAILTGEESLDERKALANDIFLYYGLGCRNVTKLYVPKNYDLNLLFEVFFEYQDVVLNNKYANNYDYYRAIYMMGKHNILENGFLILKEDKALHSPVAVLNYEYYDEKESLALQLDELKEDIQCIVGKDYIPFGKAQQPDLEDYADGVDTLRFLEAI
ncbi:MAG: acyl-CoA reductase [Flavobacteriales bacterium]